MNISFLSWIGWVIRKWGYLAVPRSRFVMTRFKWIQDRGERVVPLSDLSRIEPIFVKFFFNKVVIYAKAYYVDCGGQPHSTLLCWSSKYSLYPAVMLSSCLKFACISLCVARVTRWTIKRVVRVVPNSQELLVVWLLEIYKYRFPGQLT